MTEKVARQGMVSVGAPHRESVSDSELTATLENWSFDPHWNIFWGKVYGDTKGRFEDGVVIHTSHAKKYKDAVEGDIIKTVNSNYLLGKPETPIDSM